MNNTDTKPWYRHFWPWFLITIPLLTIIAGITMIFVSMNEPDSIVIDDYYKEGLAINRNLQRDHVAAELGIGAQLDIDLNQHSLVIRLKGKTENLKNDINILFSHPTKSSKDHWIKLSSPDNKVFKGKISEVSAGKWYVLIEPDSKLWRLKGEINLKDTGSYKF